MTTTFECFGRVLLLSLCLGGFSTVSHAQEPTKPTAQTAPRTLAEAAAQGSSSGGRTDILERVDSPRVTNILPWQEQPITPTALITISVLNEKLFNPIETIPQSSMKSDSHREGKEYSQILSTPSDSAVSPNRP